METVSSVGKGWYNYYHVSNRYETPDGKAMTAWYERDLSVEEIKSDNSGIPNREFQGADICRQVAAKFEGIAVSNRSKYSSVEEMKDAVWSKYLVGAAYRGLSHEEKQALARTEINMTMFGTVNSGEADIVAKIDGDFTKNKVGKSDEVNRVFNIKMLGTQIGNVFKNNGIELNELGNMEFRFSVNGMSNTLSITPAGTDKVSDELIYRIESALNTKENAKQLFFNLLYDSNKRGLIPTDQLTKWKLFNDFQHITGRDIREFKQTDDGFVDADGNYARDIYKDALKGTNRVPAEFTGAAYEHFTQLEKDAMRYDISKVEDLTLSLNYQNGAVMMPGEKKAFDISL